jgi:hypothetical protein
MSPRQFTGPFAAAAGRRLLAVALVLPLLLAAQQPSAAQTAVPPKGSNVSFALTAADGRAVTEQTCWGKWLVI